MKPRVRPQNNHNVRHRRIGRKVLLADRLAKTLERPSKKSRLSLIKNLRNKPRQLAMISASVVIVFAVGFAGVKVLSDQAAANQRQEVAEQQKVARARSAEADECRRQKVAQKADQVGKITYDQMYDGDSCDRP